MHTTFGYFDLIETFPKSGCAICNLLLRDVNRLLDSILYEYVTDPETQNNLRGSRGLCDQHGWELTKLGNALGVAVLYGGAMDELLKLLQRSAPNGTTQQGLARLLFPQNPNAALADALEPTQPCIACKMENASEARYVGVLSEHVGDERMQAAYRASEGLCLPHFRQTLRSTQDVERSKLLIGIQSEIWERLRAELVEFMRKSDFQHVDEKMGAEGSSWLRVVARLSGEHGVFGVRRTMP